MPQVLDWWDKSGDDTGKKIININMALILHLNKHQEIRLFRGHHE